LYFRNRRITCRCRSFSQIGFDDHAAPKL
jgi:hypothetical protein